MMGQPGDDEEEDDTFLSCEEHLVSDVEVSPNPPLDDGLDDEDQDPDLEPDFPRAHGPLTSVEKRKAQNAVLRAYAASISAQVTQEEIEETVSKTFSDEQRSIRDILAAQETTVRIQNPRDYQTELFQRAKAANVIAVLDTGSGKTHIATLLLRHVLDEEVESRARGAAHRTAFFLVDSINLVFQQANVLRCGLDQNVEGICGSNGPSLWTRSTWDKLFEKNMVIVCTAMILVECMMHSFIKMSQVNLLIFDEAHHAKSNHPYARLMKEFFIPGSDVEERPRIFGMTASPVDVKGLSPEHIRTTASDLEKLLHAKIATTSDRSLASNTVSRPDEEVAVYRRLHVDWVTPFHQEMHERYGNMPSFNKFFVNSKRYAAELGRWASDMYWSFALADEQSRKLQIHEEYNHNRTTDDNSVKALNSKIGRLKAAAEFVQQHTVDPPQPNHQDFSSKVMLLHHWLQRYYERSDEARCIVFVEQRETARLLKLIFEQIGGANLRSDMLVGINKRLGEQSISLRNQILTVAKFRRGELNCLFATSVAEEGLDIPQCNIVVRFDLYRTMIGYIQSRGRARHRNSKYLHMIEEGNESHQQRVIDVKHDEQVMRNFCQGLSQDRILNELDKDGAELLAFENKLFPSYTEPATGAKLTYRSSLSILNHFVAKYPTPNNETMLQPTFVIAPAMGSGADDYQGRGFVCEVILPEHSPITSMVGDVHGKKAIAKCSAAFKMCLALRKKGFLDPHFIPAMTKILPRMRNALLAVNEKNKGSYKMLIKPNIWKQGRGTMPEELYLTTVDVNAGLDRPHQPIAFLTRFQFPQLPQFPIFLADGRMTKVVSSHVPTSFPVPTDMLNVLTQFTLRMYLDVFNKEYAHDVSKMSYWVLPLKPGYSQSESVANNILSLIDMEQIQRVINKPVWQWTPATNPQELLDKYLIDPYNGGRRYYSHQLATHLKPQDPVPSHIPRQNHKFMKSILDYTDSMWTRTRDISRFRQDQPVLEVEKIPFRRNLLALVEEREDKEMRNLRTYVCPEPLRVSNFSTAFVAMTNILPAVVHRFESYLIAVEACKVLDLNISPALALEALTKDSENSEEHGEEKINFKSGMGPNYERLEFLGDCFLKMATSISTFVQQPNENQFEFHVRRMVMLCNQNLMETAVGRKMVVLPGGEEHDIQLYKYIRTEAFSRRTWYPEGLKLLKGKGANKSEDDWLNMTHRLGDKSIADVCEAFIGAAFVQHNQPGHWEPSHWDEAVKAVKLFANSPDHQMSKWTDYYAAYEKPQYQMADATATQLDLARKIEQQHPYKFKHPRLLRSAFIHPSQPFMWEKIPNYERLEFLGDALLDMAFITHLFYTYPDKDPHWLTEHKTPMVSNKFLGAVCVALGWHTHIRQNSATLSAQIRDYVTEVHDAQREAQQQHAAHGGPPPVDYWVAVSEPPKCLADVIEAYVAALFVDAGFDFRPVQRFFDAHLRPFFADMTLAAYETFASNHPTTRLGRLLTHTLGCTDWRLAALETQSVVPGKGAAVVAMVMLHGKVVWHALGQSGRYARVRASVKALEALEGIPPFEFRRRFGCGCVQEGVDVGVEADKEEVIREAVGLNL